MKNERTVYTTRGCFPFILFSSCNRKNENGYNGSYFYFSFFVWGLEKRKRMLSYPFSIFYYEIEKRKTKGRYIHGPGLDPHYLYLLMSIFCSFINWVSFLRILFIVIVKTGCSMACQRAKHNHGAFWLIMDLHNSLWISKDDLWISVIELWASIIGFMGIELWSSISFDLWRSITHNSIHGALQFAVIWSSKQFVEIHHPHDEAP